MTPYKTEQETFWTGEFGNEYVSRNRGGHLVAGATALFAKALARAAPPTSIIEFGANIGINLQAIHGLLPAARLSAIEINERAVEELKQHAFVQEVFHQSILEFSPTRTWDMSLIKGVLIHIAPDELPKIYDRLYQASSRYVCLIEYYNPTPVEIPYRGHSNRLFKRDFAGEMLDRFPDLKLVDYGFVYHRDPIFPLDDATWFLLEKR